MDNKEAWKIYNWIDLNYHINHYKLRSACGILNISLKEYYAICRQLNAPKTTEKELRMSDDGKTVFYVSKDEDN